MVKNTNKKVIGLIGDISSITIWCVCMTGTSAPSVLPKPTKPKARKGGDRRPPYTSASGRFSLDPLVSCNTIFELNE